MEHPPMYDRLPLPTKVTRIINIIYIYMNTSYVITFYAVIGLLILASFIAGYILSRTHSFSHFRRLFPQSDAQNDENPTK